jgi:hypothetical protein
MALERLIVLMERNLSLYLMQMAGLHWMWVQLYSTELKMRGSSLCFPVLI